MSLSDTQIQYELDYWRASTREQNDARQMRILDLWRFDWAPSVLEIGPGPYGGCLPFIRGRCKHGAEPLWKHYEQAGFKRSVVWEPIVVGIEQMRAWCSHYDAVLSMNALDHGDSGFGAIDVITDLLQPDGRFYLHVNLRTQDQLNEGHDHALKLEDLTAAIQRTGLKEIRCDVYDEDPVEHGPYRTVVGVWEK